MEELSQRMQETVMLAVLDGLDIVMLDESLSRQTVMARGWVGNRYPAYCTAQGKVLLAALQTNESDQLLKWMKFEAFGPNTIVSADALKSEFEQIERLGYAIADDEMNAGMISIAGPIRSVAGIVSASLSMGVPTNRMTMNNLLEQFREPVLLACARISEQLMTPSQSNRNVA